MADDVHPSARPLPRPWPLLLALVAAFPLMAAPVAAQEDADAAAAERTVQEIARLTVVPDGEQVFDLLTGETTLPDGGTIVDRETGLRLRAEWIAYVEGEYVHAEGARADTEAGTLRAPTLRIDVASLVASLPDGVVFERPGLTVRAASAEYRFEDRIVRFDDPEGVDTVLSADVLLLAVDSGDVLLLGPYEYQDGPFTLRDAREDAALQLRPVTGEDGVVGYRAANEVDPDLWARTAPMR